MSRKHLTPIEVPGILNTGSFRHDGSPMGLAPFSSNTTATLTGNVNNVYTGPGGHTWTIPSNNFVSSLLFPFFMFIRNEGGGTLTVSASGGGTINGVQSVYLQPGVCALIVGRGINTSDAYFLDPNATPKVGLTGNEDVYGNKTLRGSTTINDLFLPASTTSGFFRSAPHINSAYGGFNKVFTHSTPHTHTRYNANNNHIQLYTNNGTADLTIAVSGFETINGEGTAGSGTSIVIAPGEAVLMWVSGPNSHEARWLPSEPGGGVPDGGTTDEIITKIDATDGNVEWSSYPVVRSDTPPDDERVLWIDTSEEDHGLYVPAPPGATEGDTLEHDGTGWVRRSPVRGILVPNAAVGTNVSVALFGSQWSRALGVGKYKVGDYFEGASLIDHADGAQYVQIEHDGLYLFEWHFAGSFPAASDVGYGITSRADVLAGNVYRGAHNHEKPYTTTADYKVRSFQRMCSAGDLIAPLFFFSGATGNVVHYNQPQTRCHFSFVRLTG